MNIENSLFFLLIIISFIWVIKADFFFMIFGTVILLYFLILLFFMEPFDIIISAGHFFLLNPFGVLILFIPLIIHGIHQGIRKLKNFKKNSY